MVSEHRGAHRVLTHVASVDVVTSGVLLVGEDNPQSQDPYFSLWNEPPGCAGHRLQEAIFVLTPSVYRSIWRTNLCVGSWDRDAAELRCFDLIASDCPWSVLVLLGRRVAVSFRSVLGRALAPFERLAAQKYGRDLTFVSLPHPSGRCREWNDSSSYLLTSRIMGEVAPWLSWGGISRE